MILRLISKRCLVPMPVCPTIIVFVTELYIIKLACHFAMIVRQAWVLNSLKGVGFLKQLLV